MERHDLRWFEHYMPTDGSVSVTNRTTDTAVLGVCGAYGTPVTATLLRRAGACAVRECVVPCSQPDANV